MIIIILNIILTFPFVVLNTHSFFLNSSLFPSFFYYFFFQNPEGGICLDTCDITLGEERSKKKFSFALITPDRTYFFQAANEADLIEWITVLNDIITKLQKRRILDYSDHSLR
jgi:hypothetical protein